MEELKKLTISGFADEIDDDLETQLKTLTDLGMHHLSFRSAYGKNVADYSVEEAEEKIMPLLERYQVTNFVVKHEGVRYTLANRRYGLCGYWEYLFGWPRRPFSVMHVVLLWRIRAMMPVAGFGWVFSSESLPFL
jgi:hypothetical protein